MKKMILFSVLVASLCSMAMESYYPQYMVDDWESGKLRDNHLKEALLDVVSQWHKPADGEHDTLVEHCSESSGCYKHTYLSYTRAKKYIFGDIYLKRDDNGRYYLRDVYCNKKITSGVGEGKIPNQNVINAEHTWPQSRFGGSLQSWQKTDLHHLFPTDSRANSSRGNYEFGNVEGDKHPYSSCDISTVGYPEDSNESKRFFEVPDFQKGNTARAILYFAVRYKRRIQSTEEFYMRLWHEMDPVDDEEREHHERIFELQKNRNPFIDHPELVNYINDF